EITDILDNDVGDKALQLRELPKKYGHFYARRFYFGGAELTCGKKKIHK
ncbi:28036_t:CDS:1, partial [Gigaspora margarita]